MAWAHAARNPRVCAYAKLSHKSRQDAEETGPIVEMMENKVIETVGSVRRPRTRNPDHKVPGRGIELNIVNVWSLLM